jgi:hypothetical protein
MLKEEINQISFYNILKPDNIWARLINGACSQSPFNEGGWGLL